MNLKQFCLPLPQTRIPSCVPLMVTTQLVFCDYSTPKAEEFNVYSKIKELLIDKGIDRKEIAFIHTYKSESTKLKLFDDVNAGRIRVLIGSTFKLGIGANVQTKLKAIHHLDVPWRPADMTQREGRILRRGNENKEVKIFRYVSEGSFDSYSWQILETKQKFISQFLGGSSYQRSIEDLDNNVLSYAEVKAIAMANPIMKQIAEKENEVKTLEILCHNFADTKINLNKRKILLEREILIARDRRTKTYINEKYLKGITNDEYADEMRVYQNKLTKELIDEAREGALLLTFLGFSVKNGEKTDNGKMFVVLSRNAVDYLLEVGDSASGNIRRVANFLKGFNKTVKRESDKLKEKLTELEEINTSLALPNKDYDKLLSAQRELKELMEIGERNNLVEK